VDDDELDRLELVDVDAKIKFFIVILSTKGSVK
jgi:hypothetical protein